MCLINNTGVCVRTLWVAVWLYVSLWLVACCGGQTDTSRLSLVYCLGAGWTSWLLYSHGLSPLSERLRLRMLPLGNLLRERRKRSVSDVISKLGSTYFLDHLPPPLFNNLWVCAWHVRGLCIMCLYCLVRRKRTKKRRRSPNKRRSPCYGKKRLNPSMIPSQMVNV